MNKIFIIFLLTLIPLFYSFAQELDLSNIQSAVNEIKAKEQELLAKEQELKAKEIELKAWNNDLNQKYLQLTALRNEITDKLNQLNNASQQDILKVAKLYSSAKPKQAAAILVLMDIEESSAILSNINPMTAGKILDEMAKINPEYSSKLTSFMSGLTNKIKVK